MTLRILGIAAAATFMGACASATLSDPAQVVFPYRWVGVFGEALNEPSGVTYHPGRGTLFLVGDEGDLCEMELDGSIIRLERIEDGHDFEGVTVDPASGLVYIAVEDDEAILEVDPETFTPTRRFTIDRVFEGKLRLKRGNNGIESIVFVPDENHPEGGTFFVANQAFFNDDPEDRSALLEVVAPLRSSLDREAKATIVRYVPIDVIDLAGLEYDAKTDRLLAVSDSDNALLELTRCGRITRVWAFPGDNQEGIALDPSGHLHIAQDSGGVLKVRVIAD